MGQTESAFEPSLHVIPLDPVTRIPVILSNDTLVGIAGDGRISFFPMDANTILLHGKGVLKGYPLADAILERINDRFPNDKDAFGNAVVQYLAVGVMLGNKDEGWAQFIYEIWGFRERFGELDVLYQKLLSIGGTTVGDQNYTEIERYLSSESVKNWVNQLIAFLKQQLNWPEYVQAGMEYGKQRIERAKLEPAQPSAYEVVPKSDSSLKAISFMSGQFKVRDQSDISLRCVDNNCKVCAVAIPPSSYN